MTSFIRSLVLFLFLSVGLLFIATSVQAAGEDCCIQMKDQQKESCRVATFCNTTPRPVYWCVQVSRVGVTRIDDEECNGADRRRSTDVKYVRVERPVSCTFEPTCADALARFDECSILSPASCEAKNNCFLATNSNKCFSKRDLGACRDLPKEQCGPETSGSVVCRWLEAAEGGRCVQAAEAAAAGRVAGTQSDILPDCAIQGTCRSLKDLENLAFKIVDLLFTIIGSVSFAFFIYGGVVMIASFGNSDQFAKGKNILVAAIVGIIISFSAYLLIGYIYTLLGIPSVFRGGIIVGS